MLCVLSFQSHIYPITIHSQDLACVSVHFIEISLGSNLIFKISSHQMFVFDFTNYLLVKVVRLFCFEVY